MKKFESVFNRENGVTIRFFDSKTVGPTLVFANGLGGPACVFRPYFDALAESFRVIAWDYRGLYGSFAGPAPQDLSIRAHAEDLIALLQYLKITGATLTGWSMGVQVALEATRLNPALIKGLCLVCGTSGRPLEALPLPYSGRWVANLIDIVRSLPPRSEALLAFALRNPPSLNWLKRLRLVAPELRQDIYDETSAEFSQIQVSTYLELLRQLSRHDAEQSLPTTSPPALVIAGGRDRVTPSHRARSMVKAMPNAQLLIIPEATHYAAAEFPELISKHLRTFILDRAQ